MQAYRIRAGVLRAGRRRVSDLAAGRRRGIGPGQLPARVRAACSGPQIGQRAQESHDGRDVGDPVSGSGLALADLHAEVSGVMDNQALKRLTKGAKLEDGFVKPDKVKLVSRSPHTDRTLLELSLHSGANRVVRRLMDAVGFPVRKLSRIAFGPVRLGRLPVGETRELSRDELGRLLDAANM